MLRYLKYWADYKCNSTYRKVPVIGRLDFELWWCKVKISQNIAPTSILKFHIFWNLQYLILKLLEGLVQKQCFHVKMELWIAKITILCTDFQTLQAFFSQSTFHQSVMTCSIKLPHFKNAMSDFKKFCTKIDQKEQLFRK